jgi:nucleotide-binding universal stress UspA family protein
MFKTIVWATDGSANADHAFALAVALARESGCPLVAVHSKEIMTGRAGGFPLLADEDEIEAKIAKQVEDARETGIDARAVITGGWAGHAAHSIAEVAAESDADLIVVGTRGHTPVAGLFLGSVAQRLLHVAQCPVLAVPPAAHTEDALAGKVLEHVNR